MHDIYKERYFKVVKSLEEYLPGSVKYSKPGGGLNIWLSLPYCVMVNNLLKHAASENIVFSPGRIFYSGNTAQKLNNVRLSFAAVYIHQVETGIKKLSQIIDSMLHPMPQKHATQTNMPIL